MNRKDEIKAILSNDLDRLRELHRPLHDSLYPLYLARNLAADQLEVLTQATQEMIRILEHDARLRQM